MYSFVHNLAYTLDPFMNFYIAFFVWVCFEIVRTQARAMARNLETLKQEQRYWEWFAIKNYGSGGA